MLSETLRHWVCFGKEIYGSTVLENFSPRHLLCIRLIKMCQKKKVTFEKQFLPWQRKKYYMFCICACCLSYPACKAHAPYSIAICGVFNSTIFSHVIKVTEEFSEIKLLNTKRVKTSSCEITVIFVRFELNLKFFDKFLKTQVSDFFKLRLVGAELFLADKRIDRWTERYDEANSRCTKLCERA